MILLSFYAIPQMPLTILWIPFDDSTDIRDDANDFVKSLVTCNVHTYLPMYVPTCWYFPLPSGVIMQYC